MNTKLRQVFLLNVGIPQWGKRFISLALVLFSFIQMCLIPTSFAEPEVQPGGEVAVLLQPRENVLEGFPLNRSEETLLLSLKQVSPNFSTIQLEELTKFKGKALFVPVYDETPSAFLEGVLQQKSTEYALVILPMLTERNAQFETFLASMGLPVTVSQYVIKQQPLEVSGQTVPMTLPLGTFLYELSPKVPVLATWGKSLPAIASVNNVVLMNWNWTQTPPTALMQSILAFRPSVSNEAVAFNFLSNLVMEEEIHQGMPLMTVPQAGQAQYMGSALTKQPVSPSQGMVMMSVPQSTTTAANPAPVTTAAQETEVEESYPEELYEFEETGGTLSSRRRRETQNAIAEFYNDRMRELAEMQDKVNLLAGQYINNPEKHKAIQEAIYQSQTEKSKFETAWFQNNFGPALAAYDNSKTALMGALFDKVPVTQVEGRAIWLDRGTIVSSGSPDGLRQVIRRVAASGFNVIYFETVNAGYSIYPSQMTEQNPLIKGWDPLAVAIEEAHKYDVELHAWVWVFAVGNTRHNKILGQPDSFPGPILSKSEMASEALKGPGGQLLIPGQHEYWLSPASYKARNYLTSLFTEVVRNYDVDGLQLDYIRYPFQKPNFHMGYEHVSASRFTSETGLGVGGGSEFSAKAWAAWKAFQVTTFVRDLKGKLEAIKPDLKLSAAVFPIARHNRMAMIQQDWETWVRNGWIDTLNPMAYSRSARSLERLVQYIHNISDDKTLVYPGLSLIKLNAVELLDTLEIARRTGVMGTTLFAVNQFDNDKQMLLQTGPYKRRKTIAPHRDPVAASTKLVENTHQVVEGLLQSDQFKLNPGALQDIDKSLDAIHTALLGIQNTDKPYEKGFLISNIRDDARLLKQRAEQWAEWKDDSVMGYQAKIIKQLVDKTVRMVNYTTFQLTSSPGKRWLTGADLPDEEPAYNTHAAPATEGLQTSNPF